MFPVAMWNHLVLNLFIIVLLSGLCYSHEQTLELPIHRLDAHRRPSAQMLDRASADFSVDMTGGLLHTSEFAVSVELGGQKFNLQVDTSSASLVVPQVGCYTCRLGDHRYNVSLSSSGKGVSCDDDRCAPEECSSEKCGKCSSRGACCYGKSDLCGFLIKYGDGSTGKGTLVEDRLKIGSATTDIMFSAVLEETRDFELAYVDGILGLSWEQSTCHPTCVPSVMQRLVNSTGMRDIFTMCVNSFGGTLVFGKAETKFALEEYKYVDMLEENPKKHYIVRTLSVMRIGTTEIPVPGITKAIWSSATSFIGIGKDAFERILEYFLSNLCEIPDLCSVHTWFRPSSCLPLEEKWLAKFPDITFMLSEDVSITLSAEDYLIKYRKSGDKQQRCVAFLPIPHLERKGIGLVLGNSVLRRYSVVFDREKRRVGVAKCDASMCGPANGSEEGFIASSGSILKQTQAGPILSATEPSNPSLPVLPQSDEEAAKLLSAETCRALTSCDACRRNSQCAFNYRRERCVPRRELKLGASFFPYPNCHGVTCLCFVEGKYGFGIGLIIGGIIGGAILWILYRSTKRFVKAPRPYQEVQTFENDSFEAF